MEPDDDAQPLDGDLRPEAYAELVDRLAGEAADRTVDDARERGDDDYVEALRNAVWDTVGRIVPELTEPVCRRVLELADHEPDEALVDAVTEERHSDEAERLRAEAVTVLVHDVTARIAETAPPEPPDLEEYETGPDDGAS